MTTLAGARTVVSRRARIFKMLLLFKGSYFLYGFWLFNSILLALKFLRADIDINVISIVAVSMGYAIPVMVTGYMYVTRRWSIDQWTDITLYVCVVPGVVWATYCYMHLNEFGSISLMMVLTAILAFQGDLQLRHIVFVWMSFVCTYIPMYSGATPEAIIARSSVPAFLLFCLYLNLYYSRLLKKNVLAVQRMLTTSRQDAAVIRKSRIELQAQAEQIQREKSRSDELLLNILPHETAEELKQTGRATVKTHSMVTVLFADFKGFTTISELVSAELLVSEIDFCFSAFDDIILQFGLEKIKTVGDAYICAGGLPMTNYTHAADTVKAGLHILEFMSQRKLEKERRHEPPFEVRIGIHTGPVVAGIVGKRKFAYDIWGDTVNVAARMEQNSEAGKVNISGATYNLVKTEFQCVHRGKMEVKNKGEVDMYYVSSLIT